MACRGAPAAGIEFGNLSGERGYDLAAAYGQSKFANGLFVRVLARRLAPTAATANVVRPGVNLTALGQFCADCNPEAPGGLMQDDALAAQLWRVSAEITAPWMA